MFLRAARWLRWQRTRSATTYNRAAGRDCDRRTDICAHRRTDSDTNIRANRRAPDEHTHAADKHACTNSHFTPTYSYTRAANSYSHSAQRHIHAADGRSANRCTCTARAGCARACRATLCISGGKQR